MRALGLFRKRGWLLQAGTSPPSPLEAIDAPSVSTDLSHVWVEVTNACNLQCGHCYAGSGPNASRNDELDEQQWLLVLTDVLSRECKTITFIGGEPLVRLDLLEFLIPRLRQLRSDLNIRIFSNLTHPARVLKSLTLLKDCGVRFGTSLYGADPGTHDAMTKIKGSWERTIESIRILLDEGIPVFAGAYVDEHEMTSTASLSNWIQGLGVGDFKVTSPAQVGRGIGLDWKSDISGNIRPRVKDFSFGSRSKNRELHNCFADHFSIRPNGDVNPCIMMRETAYGNIVADGLEKVLASQHRQTLSKLSKNAVEGCNVCEFREGCFDCRPEAIGTSGNLLKKSDCGYDPRLDHVDDLL